MKLRLPHAAIVAINHEDELAAAIGHYTQPSDTVLHIQQHKKATGVNVGIFIDDIRDLQAAVRTARANTRTVVILSDASTITQQAQNALLKLLEEPREQLHLLLITTKPDLLLPTVQSRCQLLSYHADKPAVTLPADTKARIEFMAAGDTTLQQRLATDTIFYEQQVAIFAQAKQFVSGTPLEKLSVIAAVKESRSDALAMISAALVVCRYLLVRQFSPELHTRTATLLAADQSIRENAHVRLSLLRCVV